MGGEAAGGGGGGKDKGKAKSAPSLGFGGALGDLVSRGVDVSGRSSIGGSGGSTTLMGGGGPLNNDIFGATAPSFDFDAGLAASNKAATTVGVGARAPGYTSPDRVDAAVQGKGALLGMSDGVELSTIELGRTAANERAQKKAADDRGSFGSAVGNLIGDTTTEAAVKDGVVGTTTQLKVGNTTLAGGLTVPGGGLVGRAVDVVFGNPFGTTTKETFSPLGKPSRSTTPGPEHGGGEGGPAPQPKPKTQVASADPIAATTTVSDPLADVLARRRRAAARASVSRTQGGSGSLAFKSLLGA